MKENFVRVTKFKYFTLPNNSKIMALNFLKDLYHNVRNTLVWFVVYFFLQAVIWVALAVLILVYPQSLYVLAAVFFFILAVVSIYFGGIVAKYAYKIKKLKDSLTGDLLD